MSTKKYINKDKNECDEEKGVETKIETKIEDADVADIGDRVVTFGKSQKKSEDKALDSIGDQVRNAMDAAGNTGQYIKFVNNHIDGQRKEIEKIKKIKERFDHEVDLLQSNRTKLDDIYNDSSPNQDVNSITDSLKQLLLEKGITKSKLDNLKNEITSVEVEIENQQSQIEEVSDEIKNSEINFEEEKIKEEKKEEKMKQDLETLLKKYGVNSLSELEKLMK